MKVVEMYRLKPESKLELPFFIVRCLAGSGYPYNPLMLLYGDRTVGKGSDSQKKN